MAKNIIEVQDYAKGQHLAADDFNAVKNAVKLHGNFADGYSDFSGMSASGTKTRQPTTLMVINSTGGAVPPYSIFSYGGTADYNEPPVSNLRKVGRLTGGSMLSFLTNGPNEIPNGSQLEAIVIDDKTPQLIECDPSNIPLPGARCGIDLETYRVTSKRFGLVAVSEAYTGGEGTQIFVKRTAGPNAVVGEVITSPIPAYNATTKALGKGAIKLYFRDDTDSDKIKLAESTALTGEFVIEVFNATANAIAVGTIITATETLGIGLLYDIAFPADVVRFTLEANLTMDGTTSAHAKASLLTDTWTDSTTNIEVYDPYTGGGGMWGGLTGMRGLAIRRRGVTYTDTAPDPDEIRDVYDIVWMERVASWIEFTSTEYIGATNSGQFKVTVNHFDHQGVTPPLVSGNLFVRDISSRFEDLHSGAKGTAIWDHKNKFYRVISSQRLAMFASITLTANVSSGAVTSFTGFVVSAIGEYVGTPNTTPTSISNPRSHAGLSGDTMLLRRTNNSHTASTWEVIGVTKHARVLITNFQVDGTAKKLQKKTKLYYLEEGGDAESAWIDIHTGEDCS